ncbi:hypothetical protein RUM44_001288 [Polyplax serrata]|uniref:Tudor domain-containing protein n=1 Tax=Polyplax serrata TaxID=468196 RepID=A0ABR1AJN1_POLSC
MLPSGNVVDNKTLVIMETLEHMYLSRIYQEFRLNENDRPLLLDGITKLDLTKVEESQIAKVLNFDGCFSPLLTSLPHLHTSQRKQESNFGNTGNDKQVRNQMKLKNSTSIPADKNHKPTNVKEDLSNDQVKQENLKKTRRKKQSKQTENNVTSNSSMSDTGSSADINSPGKGEVEQVIYLLKESATDIWVLPSNKEQDYTLMHEYLMKNIHSFQIEKNPQLGNLYGCLYEGEWYRAKVISLVPEIKIHFIDYGNTEKYNNVFKLLPKKLNTMPGLVKLVTIHKQYQSRIPDTLACKIKIRQVGLINSVPVVKIVSEPATQKPEKTQNAESNKKCERTPLMPTTAKESSEAPKVKHLVDELKVSGKGQLSLLRGYGNICFGVVPPHRPTDQNLENPNGDLTPIEASNGDSVLIVDVEDNRHPAKVLEKTNGGYRVCMTETEVVLNVKDVYSPKQHADMLVAVKLEILSNQDSLKWSCLIRKLESDSSGRNAIFIKPSKSEEYFIESCFLRSGSVVRISALREPNILYVKKCGKEISKSFSEFDQELRSYWKKAKYTSIRAGQKGFVCCTEINGSVARAVVESVNETEVQVELIDSGKMVNIKWTDTKQLPRLMLSVPCFAVPVTISNLPFSEQEKIELQKLINNKINLIMTYERYLENVVLREQRSGRLINNLGKPESEVSDTKTVQVDRTAEKTYLNENEILTEDMVQWTDITCGKKYDLVILHVDEKEFDQDCSFWATDMSSNNFCSLYETLMPKLNSYCNAVHEPYSPQIREVCLARFEGNWYRALVLEKLELYTIFFLDFGNVCHLDASELRKMKSEFLEVPAMAVTFKLLNDAAIQKNPERKKKILNFLQGKLHTSVKNVEIHSHQGDDCIVSIPEIESLE